MLPYCVRTSFALPAYPTKHTKFQSVCRSLHYDHEASTVQSRRSALATAAATAALLLCPSTAGASPLTDYLRQKIRPELDPLAAVIQMLDARGTLLELELIASSPLDSDIRFRTRAYLPGMSKRLRAVGAAAPAVAALAANSSTVDSVVSSMYGGDASSDSLEPAAAAVDSIFSVLGSQILDLGGKLRPEMLDQAAGPPRLKEAVGAIDALLALLPRQTVDEAQRLRADARAANPSTL